MTASLIRQDSLPEAGLNNMLKQVSLSNFVYNVLLSECILAAFLASCLYNTVSYGYPMAGQVSCAVTGAEVSSAQFWQCCDHVEPSGNTKCHRLYKLTLSALCLLSKFWWPLQTFGPCSELLIALLILLCSHMCIVLLAGAYDGPHQATLQPHILR